MITLLVISDSDKHFSSAIAEYTKRLGKELRIEYIKPCKNGTQLQIIQKETESIIWVIEKKYKDWLKIYLSKEGEQLTTEQIQKYIHTKHTVFIIGGPYGLDEALIAKHVNKKIAFWKITIQHGLAQLILLEQIYRISCINSGKQYHY